jgi:hypothetical protein
MSESVRQVFARLMAVCERGFENEHAWKAWWKAHAYGDPQAAAQPVVTG